MDITTDLLDEYCERFRNWSRWGDDDELGTLNHITSAKVVESARLVKQGKVFSLQLPLDGGGPQTGAFGRVNAIHQMVATGTDYLEGAQDWPLGWGVADDTLFLFLQGGTQWDALAHIFHNGKMYNGYDARLVSAQGAEKNGIENQKTVVSRGVLLDIPRVVGVEHLEPGFAIDSDLLDRACETHGVEVGTGDIVLVRTGDMERRRSLPGWDGYAAGDSPGLSLTSAPWLAEREVAAIATDTWGAEVRPNEIADSFQPLHLVMVVNMGLFVGEIWYLDELAADCAADGIYEFQLVAPPLVIPGAVGSPLNPQAIK
jgi:kynurenine formamidase|tara:strand:+ start:2576 stop:3520 length:945 start_codon:yes stop_codon:yes gene_type:complete